jgi:hypothetical protein
MPDHHADQNVSYTMQATLMFMVVSLGCVDVVLRQIVAKTLVRFSYMLGLATATAYLPIYWFILLVLIQIGIVPMEQVRWVWAGWQNTLASFRRGLFSAPYVKLFMLAALGDALGNGLGYICTPYVAGPVHSLLSQCTIMFTAVLSMCMLRKRYSLAQVLGLIGVEMAVLIGVLPSFGDGTNSSDPFFSLMLAGSCAFNAFAWVVKEQAFRLYKETAEDSEHESYEALSPLNSDTSPRVTDAQLNAASNRRDTEANEDKPARQSTLHIFVVNSHVALFQLPLALLLLPLAQATGQTEGENALSYLAEGMSCLVGGSIEQGALCPDAGKYTLYYIICNIVWNWTILLNVKFNGALATFVALKAISPCSAVLFAYVDWPLLHMTPVKPLTWVVFIIIVPCIMFYVWASKQQQKREEARPPTGTCCWPLGTDAMDNCWEAEDPKLSAEKGTFQGVGTKRRAESYLGGA